MTAAGLCVSYLALIGAVGYGALSLVLGPARRHWAEVASLSWAGGFGLVSLSLFVTSLLGYVPNRALLPALGVAAVVLIVIGLLTRRTLRPSLPSRPRRIDGQTFLAIGSILLLAVTLVYVTSGTLTPGLDNIDAYACWMFKAKILVAQPLHPVPAALTDPKLSYSHQDYPLGLPMIVSGIYGVLGRVNEQLGKSVLIPNYLALIGIVYAVARSMLRRAQAIAVAAVFAAAPIVTLNAEMPVGEIPVTLEHACCAALLLRWLQSEDRRDLIACGAFAAFAAFQKHEGMALLPLVGFVALLFVALRRRKKLATDWLLGCAVAIVLILPWLLYRRGLPHTHEDYGDRLISASTMSHGLARLPAISHDFLGHLFEVNMTGGIWALLAISTAIGWRALRRPAAPLIWLLLLGHLAMYVLTFMVTPWDVTILAGLIGAKLIMHVTPVAAMLVAVHMKACEQTPLLGPRSATSTDRQAAAVTMVAG
jgi:hypothetical protein